MAIPLLDVERMRAEARALDAKYPKPLTPVLQSLVSTPNGILALDTHGVLYEVVPTRATSFGGAMLGECVLRPVKLTMVDN